MYTQLFCGMLSGSRGSESSSLAEEAKTPRITGNSTMVVPQGRGPTRCKKHATGFETLDKAYRTPRIPHLRGVVAVSVRSLLTLEYSSPPQPSFSANSLLRQQQRFHFDLQHLIGRTRKTDLRFRFTFPSSRASESQQSANFRRRTRMQY